MGGGGKKEADWQNRLSNLTCLACMFTSCLLIVALPQGRVQPCWSLLCRDSGLSGSEK
jgi:hypothetical protein